MSVRLFGMSEEDTTATFVNMEQRGERTGEVIKFFDARESFQPIPSAMQGILKPENAERFNEKMFQAFQWLWYAHTGRGKLGSANIDFEPRRILNVIQPVYDAVVSGEIKGPKSLNEKILDAANQEFPPVTISADKLYALRTVADIQDFAKISVWHLELVSLVFTIGLSPVKRIKDKETRRIKRRVREGNFYDVHGPGMWIEKRR